MRRSTFFAALALAATSPFALALDRATTPPVPSGAYTLDKPHASLVFRVVPGAGTQTQQMLVYTSDLGAAPYQASSNHGRIEPELVFVDDDRYVRWTVDRGLKANEVFEYELKVAARPTLTDIVVESQAMARPTGPADLDSAASETASISVKAKGRYIRQITLTSTMGPGIHVDPAKTRGIAEELEEQQAAVTA